MVLAEQQITTRLRTVEERLTTITNTLGVLMDTIATDDRLSGAVVVAGHRQSAITRKVVVKLCRYHFGGTHGRNHNQ